MYKKVLILINSSTKTLIWNLFFDDYKIFGNLSKVREVLLSWKHELKILSEYKHQINKVLQEIEDGTAAKTLVEEEKEFI